MHHHQPPSTTTTRQPPPFPPLPSPPTHRSHSGSTESTTSPLTPSTSTSPHSHHSISPTIMSNTTSSPLAPLLFRPGFLSSPSSPLPPSLPAHKLHPLPGDPPPVSSPMMHSEGSHDSDRTIRPTDSLSSSSSATGQGGRERKVSEAKRRPVPLALGSGGSNGRSRAVEGGAGGGAGGVAEGEEEGEGEGLMTSVSFSSSNSDPDKVQTDLLKLSALSRSIAHNLSQRPVSSLSGSSSPSLVQSRSTSPLPTRRGEEEITPEGLLELLRSLEDGQGGVLILDTRPLPSYLVSHLPHSSNLVIPSLILRRLRSGDGYSKWSGGWEGVRGFISTEGGREACDSWRGGEVVVLGEGGGDGVGAVVEGLVRFLLGEGGGRVRWVVGGWEAVRGLEGIKPLLREGEKSLPKSIHSSRSPPPPPNRIPSRSPIFTAEPSDLTPAEELSAPQFPRTASPTRSGFAVPLLRPPPLPRTRATLGPEGRGPIHHPSMPALRVPSFDSGAPAPLLSPGFAATRIRKPGPPMRIDTTLVQRKGGEVSASHVPSAQSEPTAGGGRGLPKLHLDTGGLVPPLPSGGLGKPRSATLGPAGGRSGSGRGWSGGGGGGERPPPSPGGEGSLQALCYAQSQMPPSPKSFAGMSRPRGGGGDVSPGGTARPEEMRSGRGAYSHSPTSSGTSSPHRMDEDSDDEDIEHSRSPTGFDVSTILPQFLFLGPEITTEAEVKTLEEMGVKRILNVAMECDDDAGLGLRGRFEKYLRVPLRDIVEETGVGKGVREACSFLDDARLHSAPTYVHCRAGKSRSVTIVLAYLIHANAWTLKTSYAYVAERRKGISPNIGFVAELMQYEESELGLKGSSNPGMDRPGEDDGMERANDGSGRKINKYARESLPPAWSSGGDNAPRGGGNKLTIGVADEEAMPNGLGVGGAGAGYSSNVTTPRATTQAQGGESPVDQKAKMVGLGESGTEKEVRRDGQYVHFRRAPVNEHTLQPMRRVSKAGLESLRAFASPELSPSILAQKEMSKTPATSSERPGWL